jgi:O-antigen/teichoic acid export membrane protein
MSWQDIAITVITFLLAVMLIPQLQDVMQRGAVMNFFTASFTSLLAYILCLVFASLGLWISVIGQSTVATLWLLLAFFSIRNVRNSQYPDDSLFFVARDFFSIWMMGTTFAITSFAQRLFKKSD